MKTFYVAFSTKEAPPLIRAVRIDIGHEFIRNDGKKMAINLAEHPLYADLERYVLANPSSKFRKNEDGKT